MLCTFPSPKNLEVDKSFASTIWPTCMWKVTTRTQQWEPMQMPGLTFADEMLLLKEIQLETTFFYPNALVGGIMLVTDF